jgi:molybdenum cofactor guanylyltransferase
VTLRLLGQASSEQPLARSRRQRLARGYVLAGGGSTRFGQDKALVELAGKSSLARMLEVLIESGVRETIVVGKKTRYGHLGARCIEDKWPGEGPLGGIVTALRSSVVSKYGYLWNLIVSCDMPFLTPEWLAYLLERASHSDADIVVPRSDKGLEPLCACWSTRAVRQLQHAFEDGIRKVTEAMKRVSMEIVDEKEWKRFDKAGRLFWNMNTPGEYEEARRILEAEAT